MCLRFGICLCRFLFVLVLILILVVYVLGALLCLVMFVLLLVGWVTVGDDLGLKFVFEFGLVSVLLFVVMWFDSRYG